MSARPSVEIDALLTEAYRRGYEDRSKERDYDPGHALDLLTSYAVPDRATGRWLVKRDGVTVSLTPEEYAATRVTSPDSAAPEPACVTCQDRGVWMDNPCADCPDAAPEEER